MKIVKLCLVLFALLLVCCEAQFTDEKAILYICTHEVRLNPNRVKLYSIDKPKCSFSTEKNY